jgi:tRNA-dihydrouridine synthase B
MTRIGQYTLPSPLILAPMAGITDLPFRKLCRQFGAGLAVSEMVTSDIDLWHSRKSQQRLTMGDEPGPISVQIAGSEPEQMALAAAANAARGADIIDINMGCPAKKVCKKAAGSSLLRDEALVNDILQAVVGAVSIPVTLKIRTGWDNDNRNACRIANIAENAGIQSLAVHGRTRADRFNGDAEYDTIAAVVNATSIPVFANGDITSAYKAKQVLDYTGAAGLLIGRAAQGQPWLFQQINHFLQHGEHLAAPSAEDRAQIMLDHVGAIHDFYGEHLGVRIARKHVGWYMQFDTQSSEARVAFNRAETPAEQFQLLHNYFNTPSFQKEAA